MGVPVGFTALVLTTVGMPAIPEGSVEIVRKIRVLLYHIEQTDILETGGLVPKPIPVLESVTVGLAGLFACPRIDVAFPARAIDSTWHYPIR